MTILSSGRWLLILALVESTSLLTDPLGKKSRASTKPVSNEAPPPTPAYASLRVARPGCLLGCLPTLLVQRRTRPSSPCVWLRFFVRQ